MSTEFERPEDPALEILDKMVQDAEAASQRVLSLLRKEGHSNDWVISGAEAGVYSRLRVLREVRGRIFRGALERRMEGKDTEAPVIKKETIPSENHEKDIPTMIPLPAPIAAVAVPEVKPDTDLPPAA